MTGVGCRGKPAPTLTTVRTGSPPVSPYEEPQVLCRSLAVCGSLEEKDPGRLTRGHRVEMRDQASLIRVAGCAPSARPAESARRSSPGTTMSDMYGTVAGSTSATGNTRWPSREARST